MFAGFFFTNLLTLYGTFRAASNLAKLGVTSLTSLSLNVNNLSSLRSLQNQKKLERLSLKDNKISSLAGLKYLQKLVELMVDVNSLTSLAQLGDSCWFNLVSFSANTNKISSLPPNLSSNLPSLCTLNLYQNCIENIEVSTFQNLHSLTALDLGRNRLRNDAVLGESLSRAPSLRKLILSQNCLQNAPVLRLPLLQQLWLGGNKISSFQSWRDEEGAFMPCLSELYLQENAISRIGGSGAIGFACPLIEKLDLSFNCMEHLDDVVTSLLYLDRLKSLNIQDNPVVASDGDKLNERILLTLPGLAYLNNASLGSDAKWGAFCSAVSGSAEVVMPHILVSEQKTAACHHRCVQLKLSFRNPPTLTPQFKPYCAGICLPPKGGVASRGRL